MTDALIAPQDPAAEEHVLGSMLISRTAINACTELLHPDDFYRPSNGLIYKAIVDLDLQDQPVDTITITDYMREHGDLDNAGGHTRILELTQIVPATANVAHYARIVRTTAHLRGLITAGQNICRLGYERPGPLPELQEQAEQLIFELSQHATAGDLEHIRDSLHHTHQLLLEHEHHEITGTPSGLKALDTLTAGFQPGNLVVIAGRPSMGKSALALGIARHVTSTGVPVALFTLEMSKVEVDQRLLSLETGVHLQSIRRAKNLPWPIVTEGFNTLAQRPLYLDDSGTLRLGELRTRARRLKARQPELGLVIVDYLQLMAGEADSRVQEVSQISRGLKTLARDLNVPVLALSQLSRNLEYRNDKRPILSDLRESGSIEQDADLVVFVYRESVYSSDADEHGAKLIVAKHRNGPIDDLDVAWSKQYARFTDAA